MTTVTIQFPFKITKREIMSLLSGLWNPTFTRITEDMVDVEKHYSQEEVWDMLSPEVKVHIARCVIDNEEIYQEFHESDQSPYQWLVQYVKEIPEKEKQFCDLIKTAFVVMEMEHDREDSSSKVE